MDPADRQHLQIRARICHGHPCGARRELSPACLIGRMNSVVCRNASRPACLRESVSRAQGGLIVSGKKQVNGKSDYENDGNQAENNMMFFFSLKINLFTL